MLYHRPETSGFKGLSGFWGGGKCYGGVEVGEEYGSLLIRGWSGLRLEAGCLASCCFMGVAEGHQHHDFVGYDRLYYLRLLYWIQ